MESFRQDVSQKVGGPDGEDLQEPNVHAIIITTANGIISNLIFIGL
jgi:hypothetical protein